jgi:hypothetical protein
MSVNVRPTNEQGAVMSDDGGLVQLLTDPENQPHQYVGDPVGLRALLVAAEPLAARPPSGEQAVRDAARYEWMLDEPEGAQHLLNLLKQKKGTKEDFGKMIDRIRASKAASPVEAKGKP